MEVGGEVMDIGLQEHSFDRRAHPLFSSDDFRQALSRQQMEPLSINRSSSPSGVDYRGAWFSIQHKYNVR